MSGTVRDSVTNSPLPAANIRVLGTAKGTIANAMGVYKLSLDRGDYTIVFSFIGFRSDTVRVALDRPISYSPRLQPSTIQMPEVIVTSEDPAVAIMRKVIERKKIWADSLRSYEFDAFTRLVMRRDTAIAAITESYSTGYWQMGDTLREVIKQKRLTENLPGAASISVGGFIVNFYDDDIEFAGFHFVGPTAPEAFDYYDFKLAKTRQRDDIPVYTILVIPKSRLTPLYRGRLDVIGDSYALIGVDMSPNEAFTIPFVSRFDLHYKQQFGLYEGRYWMPMDISLDGLIDINVLLFTIPRIVVEQASVIYDYKINRPLPDTIFHKPHTVTLASAQKFDSLFWAQHDVLPLTSEEQKAYKSLDSTQTLDKQFKPTGPLTSFEDSPLGLLAHVSFRYDRAEGLFLGANGTKDSLIGRLSFSGSGGYGFSDKRPKFDLEASAYLDSSRRTRFSVTGYKALANIPDEGYYPPFTIGLAALLNKNDYRDYYYADGWRASLHTRLVHNFTLQLEYQNEDERSADVATDFSIFERRIPFRQNPQIIDGVMRSVKAIVHAGEPPVPFGLSTSNFIEVELEHSAPDILASDFDFRRILVRGEGRITTYSRRLLFPPTLSVKVRAGTSWGALPPQRLFALESQYDDAAPFGVLRAAGVREFIGQKFFSLSVEHNFRSTPFLLLNIPYLYTNNVEFILHGSVAQTWSAVPLPFGRTTDGWYSEGGFGISRILTLFRADLTYRFATPRGFRFTFGIAQLF